MNLKKHQITIDNTLFDYWTTDNGKTPLICIHGWAASYSNFLPIAPFLEKHFDLFLFDFPGNFEAPEWKNNYYIEDSIYFLSTLIKTLQIQNYFLLGESYGSLIALKFFLESKNSAAGIILISLVMNVPSFLNNFFASLLKFLTYSFLFRSCIAFILKNKKFQTFWVNLLINKNTPYFESIKKITMEELNRVCVTAYIQGYISILRVDTNNMLKKLFMNNVINKELIYGKSDPFSKWRNIENVSKNPYIVIMDNCQHSPHLEQPEEFYNTIKVHLLNKI